MGALAWVRENGDAHADLVTDEAKAGLVKGIAAKDPKQALELISEFKLENAGNAIAAVASAAGTAEQRSDTLEALRDLAAKSGTSEKQRTELHNAVSILARNAAREGFTTGTQWIESAGFTQDELRRATQGFTYSIKRDETGQWIDWLGKKLPAGKLADPVRDMIRNWTQADYRAAGQWLGNAADGPAKQVAIRGYAETVARYDPETASQWALTLPAGNDRKETMQNIYQSWPKEDDASKAAAEAFASQHGIDK
jgi:hypothetical protein